MAKLPIRLFGKASRKAAGKAAGRTAAKVAGRKAARKAAARTGAKVAAKVGARGLAKYGIAATGVGLPVTVALASAEALPTASRELQDVRQGARERMRQTREAYRRKEYAAALKHGAKGILQTDVDIAKGLGRTALAAFTAKEVADMTRAQRNSRRNGALAWGDGLLSAMIALRAAYQYAHWNAQHYADHLLFERLYKSLDADTDALAELLVQATGRVEPLFARIRPDQVETAEQQILAVAAEALKGGQAYDMSNLLANLVEHRQRALYLLRQRSR